ncbi:(2Fe-2S) ferredoxin [Hypericibacter terrae]|uniref:(2Fe-2S) ferredoxin n=1 Tax=Hypericibacter terrae TaxID=2602015 RepID=A0A5J6MMZ1_9PROT|nr:aromatic ring-hydroxylating dioxygenase subunit alpha [Hypericibacter terrae]QEX18918.1 (2Fe-2S) ferredoxin [Hypericibacter terrae]
MIPITLPAWIYANDEFFALECEAIFRRTWQLVGHVNELKQPGDFLRFDLLGESAIVLRDKQGRLQAFHNVCRHRAFRLLEGDQGNCGRAVRCRYHGFLYDLDGRLMGVPSEDSFPGLDKSEYGLRPVEMEIFLGLVFIRFGGDGPSIAEQFEPYREALGFYRIAEMEPLGPHSHTPIAADWKVAVENNSEAYHVPVGHPGLQRLYGTTYRYEVKPLGVSHGGGRLIDRPSPSWSERHYLKLLPPVEHLPEDRRRAWLYYSMFPSLAFDIYPDQIDYFQILPLSPGRCIARSRAYALPDARREMKAARWLNQRINRLVGAEDKGLVEGVQAGLGSSGYRSGILSAKEVRVQQFQSMIRAAIPVAGQETAPEAGSVARRNRELKATQTVRESRPELSVRA